MSASSYLFSHIIFWVFLCHRKNYLVGKAQATASPPCWHLYKSVWNWCLGLSPISAGLQVNHRCRKGTSSQCYSVSCLMHVCVADLVGSQPGIVLQLRIWLSGSSLGFLQELVVRHDCLLSYSFSCTSFGLSTLLKLAEGYLSEDWCNKFHAMSPVSEVFSAHYSSSSWSWTDSLY